MQPSAAGGALSTRVLEETSTGRLLLAYLQCVDIDCAAALGAVSAVGRDVVPLLVQLLRYGVARELSAALPGDGPTVVRLRALQASGEVRDMRVGPAVCAHADDGYGEPGAMRSRWVEMADALSPAQLRGEAALPTQLPLTHGVERAFLDRSRPPAPRRPWEEVLAS